MRIAIRKEPSGIIYIDKTALERFDEETLKQPPYNYDFVEVDKEDCTNQDFNQDLSFSIEKYNNRKNKEDSQRKIAKLKNWFNTEYRYKDEKYNRLIILGKTDDDGVSAEVKRKDLYEEAEKVRKQIQELEKLV